VSFRRISIAFIPLLALAALLIALPPSGGQTPGSKNRAKSSDTGKTTLRQGNTELVLRPPWAELNAEGVEEDFPDHCLTADGVPAVVFVEHDGKNDVLALATIDPAGDLVRRETIAAPKSGNVYQPCLTRPSDGSLLAIWSQLEDDGQWDLWARAIAADGSTATGEPARLTKGHGNDIFADLGTDRHGRVWLTWQRLEEGISNVFARHRDPETGDWSEEITVTNAPTGDWEPRLAFGAEEEALILFDSYRNGDFDVFLARVTPENEVRPPLAIAKTARYEARAAGACSPDGQTLWVAYEDGMERWGKDLGAEWRRKGGGLHHDRQLKVVRVDLGSDEVNRIADVTALLPDLVADPSQVGTGAIDVPELAVDAAGHPWVFFRYCLLKSPGYWQIAASRLDPDSLSWTKPEVLGESRFCLDRRTSVTVDPESDFLLAVYPGDLRKNKQAGDAGVYLARLRPDDSRISAGPMPFDLVQHGKSGLEPYNDTPERARDDHHTWNAPDESYTLYWGDVHRHTDFSNCRTTDDGCIVEHFRYALEAGGLDYLATSDHTEIGKVYSPYEWWQTQKLADLFHNPGSFVSLYAYEREQKYPYGHRNVLFQERGGPIVYIQRKHYRNSPWATALPKPDGDRLGEIPPWQLWDLLREHGQRAVTIEHTSAGGMGTDWSKYKRIDPEFETVLEVFQRSRQSYEGEGAPQPPIVVGKPKTSRFRGRAAKGTWQEALRLNHRLGAFASSDHRSVHVSYGGVYVTELSRAGIFDALQNRRTVAATDKIDLEFACNDRLLGEIFTTTEKPRFDIAVEGTAPLSRITLVRNEEDYHEFSPESESPSFSVTHVDENPVAGENRYYLRVEQVDGNMGWISPVWVTVEPEV